MFDSCDFVDRSRVPGSRTIHELTRKNTKLITVVQRKMTARDAENAEVEEESNVHTTLSR